MIAHAILWKYPKADFDTKNGKITEWRSEDIEKPFDLVSLEQEYNQALINIRKEQRLSEIRYQKEIGGIEFNGIGVQTDRETRANLIGARIMASENPSYQVKWKTDQGFVTLDAQSIILVADAVAEHVQKCFQAEEVVLEDIESIEDINEAFEAAYLGEI